MPRLVSHIGTVARKEIEHCETCPMPRVTGGLFGAVSHFIEILRELDPITAAATAEMYDPVLDTVDQGSMNQLVTGAAVCALCVEKPSTIVCYNRRNEARTEVI